jgi:octanoyl-[GcvH]:protein N-octanoyltransferase
VRLLTPQRFEDPVMASGYTLTVFERVASGRAPATVSILPSARHVGVTRRDTTRPGFREAVRAANALGYPVLVRGAGGGATAADRGTFGFSLTRSCDGGRGYGSGHRERYDEAAAFVLSAFARLGISAEVGEVRDEFCPGDHSLRIGGPEGMKVVGIAQRVTRRAASVGGIVLVEGDEELAHVLERVYGAMGLPFRPESVGSLRRAGYAVGVEEVIEAFAREAEERYGAERVPVGREMLEEAHGLGQENLVVFEADEEPVADSEPGRG